MNNMASYRLHLSVLSPVHLGCNETYEPTNYVMDDQALYEFDTEQAMNALDERQRKELLRIVNGRADENLLKQVQAFFHRHRQALMALSEHFIPVSEGVARLYQARIGKIAQQESGGKKVLNKLEIERTAYNPVNRQPIIPGSGLKGALRTAVLDALNQGRPLPAELKNDRQASRKLQQWLLEGSFDTDPFRLVQISDARWQGGADMPASDVRFAVNRRRKISYKNGQLVRSKAEQDNLYQLLETLRPLQARVFELELVLHQPQTVLGQNKKLPAFQFSMKDLAAACNAFYRPILVRELDLIENLGYANPQWVAQVRKLLDTLDKQRFLLRVGRHSGAESVTLNGVRSIRIMGGKKGKDSWEPEPKTLWLAAPGAKSREGMLPFGWLLVEVEPRGAPEFAQNWQDGGWRKWQQQRLAALRAQREQLHQERLKREEQARQAAEAERKAAEQAAALAAMSKEQRALYELEQQLEKDIAANNTQAGGLLNDMRLALLEQALEWDDAELRKQAAALIRRTAKLVKWAKKRKADVQEKLARLEQSQ